MHKGYCHLSIVYTYSHFNAFQILTTNNFKKLRMTILRFPDMRLYTFFTYSYHYLVLLYPLSDSIYLYLKQINVYILCVCVNARAYCDVTFMWARVRVSKYL